jgi:hypothetical protein
MPTTPFLWFMLKKKSENVRLMYCDGKDKYLHPTKLKDVENIYFIFLLYSLTSAQW